MNDFNLNVQFANKIFQLLLSWWWCWYKMACGQLPPPPPLSSSHIWDTCTDISMNDFNLNVQFAKKSNFCLVVG
jgi:hypothetical protein